MLSAKTPKEALAKYAEAKQLFVEIGMNLREFVSNCSEVNDRIPEKDRTSSGCITFLGVQYNTDTDRFSLSVDIKGKEHLTKKDVVSQINSVYDPIGLAGPLLIKLKSIMREIYETGIGWKESVPNDLVTRWNDAVEAIRGTSLRY